METSWIFWSTKLHQKSTWKQLGSKLHQKKYVATTWIFRPSKLHRKKYVGTALIFRSVKLHRKNTRKWRRNLSKFGLWRIDVISTSNWRRFDVESALGMLCKKIPFFKKFPLLLEGLLRKKDRMIFAIDPLKGRIS